MVHFWASQRKQEPVPIRLAEDVGLPSTARGEAEDPFLGEARSLAEQHKHISASFLQRRLRIGYPRAARIMEQLEAEGVGGGKLES